MAWLIYFIIDVITIKTRFIECTIKYKLVTSIFQCVLLIVECFFLAMKEKIEIYNNLNVEWNSVSKIWFYFFHESIQNYSYIR